MTIQEAKTLCINGFLYSKELKNVDGTPQKFKILSIKTWKTRPERIRISCKRGLYQFIKIDETQLHHFI